MSLAPLALLAACGSDDDDTTADGGKAEDGGPSTGKGGGDATIGSDGSPSGSTDSGATTSKDGGAGPADATVTDGSAPGSDAGAGDGSADGATDAGDAGSDAAADAGKDAGDAGPASVYALYDADQIPGFALTVDQTNYNILANTATDTTSEDAWATGDVVVTSPFGTETFTNVGIRRKGASTFRYLPNKAALKIQFNKNVKGQKFHGLEQVTLNNMVSDGTFLAERLGYYAFRTAGLPAEYANTATLTINGASYGIYANVETLDQDFVTRAFGANGKTLYESNGGGDWKPGEENNFDIHVGTDYSDLTVLFKASTAATTLLGDLSTNLDTTEYLEFCALEGLVGQIDGYAYGQYGSHNNDVAGDVNDKFSMIPWSLDATFTDNNGVLDMSKPLPADPANPTTTLTVLGRCKASTACWASYKTAVSNMITVYDNLDLATLAGTWHTQIDALALADPKKEINNAGYEAETTKLYAWIKAQGARAKTQLGL